MDGEKHRRGNGLAAGAAGDIGDERLLRIIERNADGMMVVDGDGVVRFANAAAGELFGREPDELLDEPFGFPLVGEDSTELDVVRRGEERVAELRIADFEWEGQPAHLVSLRDITARKRAAEQERQLAVEQARRASAELRAERNRFLAEVGNALETSLALEPNLEALCVLCGKGFADWCAVDLVEEGAVMRRACSTDVGEALLAELVDAHNPELRVDPLPAELAADLADQLGGDWHDASLLRVPITVRGEVVGVFTMVRRAGRPFAPDELEIAREVGRRAGVSVEHALLFEETRQADRAKADFLAVVSHELRTPLNAVIGYADLMLMGVGGELVDQQEQHVKKIRASSQHLLQLVEEILTYIRTEGGQEELELGSVELRSFLEETADIVAPMAEGADLELRTDFPVDGMRIVTDPRKARQVLINLLSNAVKYTREGSIEFGAEVAGDSVVFTVKDTGIGMSGEQLSHIYDPFWQADPASIRRSGGTGLGLTVAQRLTELLEGELNVRSSEGDGTTFRLRLPLRHPAADAEGGAVSEGGASPEDAAAIEGGSGMGSAHDDGEPSDRE